MTRTYTVAKKKKPLWLKIALTNGLISFITILILTQIYPSKQLTVDFLNHHKVIAWIAIWCGLSVVVGALVILFTIVVSIWVDED